MQLVTKFLHLFDLHTLESEAAFSCHKAPNSAYVASFCQPKGRTRMKLDVGNLRYLSKDDFKILAAIEQGMRNHEVVPTELIASIAGLRGGGISKMLGDLLRAKLISHEHLNYEGYTLTYPGYDFLALKTFLQRGTITGVGRQIGVGKESDIFLVQGPHGQVYALKLQRLGRTSFRAVKAKRDYLKHRKHASWLYMSRLAALKEYAFMRALSDAGFPVPAAIGHNRHALIMTLARGRNMSLCRSIGPNPGAVFDHLMTLMLRLASCGLIHCDFNEFNLLAHVPGTEQGTVADVILREAQARHGQSGNAGSEAGSDAGDAEDETGVTPIHPLSHVPGTDGIQVTLIDFPQMVSLDHPNAGELWDRDVRALAAYFARRFGFEPESVPSFTEALAAAHAARSAGGDGTVRLDKVVEASGFSAEMEEQLQGMMQEQRGEGAGPDDEGSDEHREREGDAPLEAPASLLIPAAGAGSDSAGAAGPAFVTVGEGVLQQQDMDGPGSEGSDNDDDDEEGEESDSSVDALSEDDPHLAAERVPEGLRGRHGRKPKPQGGEAYLRKVDGDGQGGRAALDEEGAAGMSSADIRARVKGAAEKARTKEAHAVIASRAAKAHKGGRGSRAKDKVGAKEFARGGSASDAVWG